MIDLILRVIEEEARKRIARYSKDRYYKKKYQDYFRKRTGKRPKLTTHSLPPQWSFHPHFDPRYCINHSKFIARGIWNSLRGGNYVPLSSYRVQIPKASGGFRNIDAFSIPDAAVAKIFLHNLRTRNATIFSDSSYAYQNNKTHLDAILKLRSLLQAPTVFVSQFDFASFFDSIDHGHITSTLSKSGPFLTTSMERSLLHSVVRHRYTTPRGESGERTTGIPQGNSLSLFLANVAAHWLDTELTRLNGAFARFADDSVIINYSYEDALKSAKTFQMFAELSGVSISSKKSTGVRILSDQPCEIAHIDRFNFLSYAFTTSGLRVSDKSVMHIKRRCIKIIYNHLLLHPRRVSAFNRKRLGKGFRDWDLVTCVNELRAAIYGGRRQTDIDAFLAGRINLSQVTGLISYFCLVESGGAFRELDGWLINVLRRAYKERIRLLNSIRRARRMPGKPYRSLSERLLRTGEWYEGPLAMETRPPSFHLAWRASRKSWMQHGLGGVDATGDGYAYS